jgi:hypothetical protein
VFNWWSPCIALRKHYYCTENKRIPDFPPADISPEWVPLRTFPRRTFPPTDISPDWDFPWNFPKFPKFKKKWILFIKCQITTRVPNDGRWWRVRLLDSITVSVQAPRRLASQCLSNLNRSAVWRFHKLKGRMRTHKVDLYLLEADQWVITNPFKAGRLYLYPPVSIW